MYRALKVLDTGGGRRIYPGSLVWLDWLDEAGIDILKTVGAICEVHPPPLSILPGWKRRSKRVEKLGLLDVVAFMEATTEMVAEALGVKPNTVDRWKHEVSEWLIVKKSNNG